VKRIAILFSLFILLIIVLADLGKLGILGFLNSIPYADKAGHLILYGILTLLLDLTFIRARPDLNRRSIVLRTAWILALAIGIEEYSQRFFANRTFSLLDLIFSYLGVIFFSLFALKIK
jgi:VanZ family protein